MRRSNHFVAPRRALLAASLSLCVAVPAWSQSSGNEDSTVEDTVGLFTERVDVRVVNVDVVVTDRKGEPIVGLEKDDFVLRANGQVLPVSNFYAETGGTVGALTAGHERPSVSSDPSFRTVEEVAEEAPRRSHVVVLVDHTRLRPRNRKRAFNALREALARLDSEDLISVVGIEGSLVFYSDFLYDRRVVERILDDVEKTGVAGELGEIERRQIFGELARGMSGGIQARASLADDGAILARIRAYAEEEYARSLGSMRQIEGVLNTLGGVPGRKALLYVGEGIPARPGEGLYTEWINRFGGGNPNAGIGLRRFDFNTDYTREIGRFDLNREMVQLGRAANRVGVTLYAVDAVGDHGAIVRSALTEQGAHSDTLSVIDENFRAPLEAATKATGGRLLRSSGLLDEQLLDVVGDLQTFYSLGFVAPDDWQDGEDYEVDVRVKGQRFTVRHREEVRLPKPDEVEAAAMVATLMYQTANNPLDLRATPGDVLPREDGNAGLPIDVEVPIAKLGFVPREQTQAGSLTIYVSRRGADGNPSKVQKIPFHLNIPTEVMPQALGDSARYQLPLVLSPGDQHVAIGVRDNVNGAFSAVRLDVSVLSAF